MTEQKSDLSRAFSEDGALKTHVGGQALLEGIMMRGRYNWAVAVREPEGGIYTEEHDLAFGKDKSGWLYWPFIRGCRAFVEALVLSYKALSVAVEHAFVEEDEEGEGAEAAPTAAKPVQAATPTASAVAPALEPEEPDDWIDRTPWPGSIADPSKDTKLVDDAYSMLLGSPEQAGKYTDDGEPNDWIDRTPWPVIDPNKKPDPAAAQASAPAPAAPAPDPEPAADQPKEKNALLGSSEMAVSMTIGIFLGVVLFVVAPAFITNLIVGEYDSNTLLWNIVDGILRIAVFIFYIWLIGRMSDIKRMFGYHGAEHKAIHCFEHGLEMTPENARKFPRLHVRCGTAFLIMVMIIAIFVYTITPLDGLIAAWGVPAGAPKLALVIAVRILLMPLIAGISYEITVRWAGTHPENPLVKVVLWPGMQMQYLTTREPDDGQIECAIAAMKLVLEREDAEDAKASAGIKAAASV